LIGFQIFGCKTRYYTSEIAFFEFGIFTDFLSSNYLGDLIKKETGKSPQDHIQLKLMDIAKEKIFDTSKSISEIAYDLGFKHPQHFSRMFKNETRHTPFEYRLLN